MIRNFKDLTEEEKDFLKNNIDEYANPRITMHSRGILEFNDSRSTNKVIEITGMSYASIYKMLVGWITLGEGYFSTPSMYPLKKCHSDFITKLIVLEGRTIKYARKVLLDSFGIDMTYYEIKRCLKNNGYSYKRSWSKDVV